MVVISTLMMLILSLSLSIYIYIYICIYIYIYIYTVTYIIYIYSGEIRSVLISSIRKISNWGSRIPEPFPMFREFKDVVFEDVVFDNNRCYLYPILRFYLIWRHRTIIIKRHILKHHIPELPNVHFTTTPLRVQIPEGSGKKLRPIPLLNCGFPRVGLEHNLNLKGWNFQAHREFPGKFESGMLVGTMLVGRLGVGAWAFENRPHRYGWWNLRPTIICYVILYYTILYYTIL